MVVVNPATRYDGFWGRAASDTKPLLVMVVCTFTACVKL